MRQSGGSSRWLLGLLGVLVTGGGLAAVFSQSSSGAQPWSATLSDNVIFAKSIPFILGLGVVTGVLRSSIQPRRPELRPSDGAIRRFSVGTVVGHWVNALGFLLALMTGIWQYLGGILDVSAPVPLHLFYRLHYLGATLILFSASNFVTAWWLSDDRSLLVPRGQWIRHLRGLAHELPGPLGAALAMFFGLDMRRQPPLAERFTFYEKVVSFPSWLFVITLITVTGIIKTIRYLYPIPGELLFWASTLHVAAMVLIIVKLLDHLRYVFARWPLLVAMATTWIDGGYVKARHPAWHRQLTEEAPAAPAETPASVSAVATGLAGGNKS